MEELLQLPRTRVPWLLASDAADLIGGDLYQACQRLRQEQRSDVRFLLACRDTDWVAAKAHKWDWITRADFRRETISGLRLDEAIAIVGAWVTFGDEATCRFTVQDQEAAARQLLEAAREEAIRRDGALLGALLKVRFGDDLKEHVKALLNRLAERKIPGGGDLLLAFAYVAAMHAEGLDFLSRPVLAEALSCPIHKLNPLVLAPLGMEAATSSDGQFILTRHREIARIAVDLLQDVFSIDIEGIYLELVESAVKVRAKGESVLQLERWYYNLPNHFFEKGRRDFAIKIGRTLLDQNPKYAPLRVHLSRLYREAGDSGRAVRLFRDFEAPPRNRRVCMMEWGRSAGAAGQHGASSVLIAFSLADAAAPLPPDNKNAKMAFDGLAEAFDTLYDQYHDSAFNRGRATVARLGLTLRLDDTSRARFMKHLHDSGETAAERLDLDRELSRFTNAVRRARELGCADAESLGQRIPSPARMTFQHLKRLLINASLRTRGTSDEESQRTL